MNAFFQKSLDARKAAGNYRRLKLTEGLVDFCSNDYLGLAASSPAGSTPPHGATGSRLISGNSTLLEDTETAIAQALGAEAGLIFNTGYMANLGLLSSIPQRGDTIIYDKLVHASIRDGIRLSHAAALGFAHNDLEDLEKKIEKAKGRKFLVVESVYSMDGDTAPLPAMLALAQSHQVAVIVDEAHALGVVGAKGEGLVAAMGLEKEVMARVITFGKSLGSHGAMVLGSALLRDYLINFCRPFIYTTAPPPSTVAIIRHHFDQMLASDLTKQLQQRIVWFKAKQAAHPWAEFIPAEGAIQSLLIPGNEEALAWSGALEGAGLDVRAILHPTVPAGQERLRICLHAFNTQHEIEKLWEVLATQHLIRQKKIEIQ